MSTDEQRVRTMAGWIGVEISKSRVRTPGKAGYGLYRVRGQRYVGAMRDDRTGELVAAVAEWSEWTAYAFTLDAIYLAVQNSIQGGTPQGPVALHVERAGWRDLSNGGPYVVVPTRWTSAYRGRRDLGNPRCPVCENPHERMKDWIGSHQCPVAGGACSTCQKGCARRRDPTRFVGAGSTVRQRRREFNAAFQAEHAPAREAGLRARHAVKLERGTNPD